MGSDPASSVSRSVPNSLDDDVRGGDSVVDQHTLEPANGPDPHVLQITPSSAEWPADTRIVPQKLEGVLQGIQETSAHVHGSQAQEHRELFVVARCRIINAESALQAERFRVRRTSR